MNQATRWWIAGAFIALCVTFGIFVQTETVDVSRGTDTVTGVADAASTSDGTASETEADIREELEAIGFVGVPANVTTSLATLEKVDDYPVYTMRYVGPYVRASELERVTSPDPEENAYEVGQDESWACSLFAAVGDPEHAVLGRNFDWEYSPILVVFLEPEEGYTSVMSIDIAYLIEPEWIDDLDEAPVEQRLALLSAPFLTFDGMNEKGLAIGMASVDYECGYSSDPDKRDVGDLRLMREVLESSASVEEALTFLEGINPVSQGGPNTHYLVADRTGAALIEYHEGEMYVFRSREETPWQLGTNFPVVLTEDEPIGHCWRYDRIETTLRAAAGVLSTAEAAELLQNVSTPMTRWSIVYDLAAVEMHLVIEWDSETVHTFSLGEDTSRP